MTKSKGLLKRYPKEIEAKILIMFDQGKWPDEIAAMLDIPEWKVEKVLRKNKKKYSHEQRSERSKQTHFRKSSEELDQQVKYLIEELGYTQKAVAEGVGILQSTVTSIRNRTKDKNLTKEEIAQRHTVYGSEVVEQIKSMTYQGQTAQKIAKENDINERTVNYLRYREGISGQVQEIQKVFRQEERKRISEEIVKARIANPVILNKDLAKLLGISSGVFKTIVSEFELYLSDEHLAARYSLSSEVVQRAIELRKKGVLVSEISTLLGVQPNKLAKLFVEEGIRLTPDQRSENATRISKYTWKDVKLIVQSVGFFLLDSREDDEPLDVEYINVRCKCSSFYSPRVYDLLIGKIHSCGCDQSRQETEIKKMIQGWAADYGWGKVEKTRSVIAPLELDIFLESKDIAIEYCGQYYHGQLFQESKFYTPEQKEFIKRRNEELGHRGEALVLDSHLATKAEVIARDRHKKKLDKCLEKGIRLITIFSDEWIQKPKQVRGYLKAILGAPLTTVGARELLIERVDIRQVRDFIEENHIQGSSGYAAFVLKDIHDAIYAAATFQKRNNKDWMLSRYCVKIDYAVPGGLPRLLKAFKEEVGHCHLITFADKRWSQGTLYKNCGFTLEKEWGPSYTYMKYQNDQERYHKSNFRKNKIAKRLGPLLQQETEWAAMKRFGYDRIWDCGLQRWGIDL